VDHTIIDFGLIETHAKLKKLKNTSETVMDKVSNQVLGAVHATLHLEDLGIDGKFKSKLAQGVGLSAVAEMNNFPINDFEREFPFIDRYAIS
jgi:hypothetical protein